MRYIKLSINFLIVLASLSGCVHNKTETVSMTSLPYAETALQIKSSAPTDYRNLYHLNLVDEMFSSGGDWYGPSSFLYITEHQGQAHLYRYDLFSKKNKLIYQNDYPILDVTANVDRSLFALRIGGQESLLQIIDRSGQVVYQWEDKAINYDVSWNPYNPKSLLLIAYYRNWSYQIFTINLTAQQIKKVPLKEPNGQWMGKHALSDLNWGNGDESYKASLGILDLATNKVTPWKTDVINYLTLGRNIGLILTAKSLTDHIATYSFYQMDNLKKITKINIPSIQTYSEYWWMPYYQYLDVNHSFYYFRPVINQQTSSVSFNFVKYDVSKDKQKTLLTKEVNQPIRVSPNGQWVLYGTHYSTFISLVNGKKIKLEKK